MLMRYDDVKSAKPNLIQAHRFRQHEIVAFFFEFNFFWKIFKDFYLDRKN